MNHRTLKILSLDIRTGRCSGIPWCCIAFFTLLWQPFLLRSPKFWKAYHDLVLKHSPQGIPGYVPCPLCIKHPIKVKRCTKTCGHNQEWELLSKS